MPKEPGEPGEVEEVAGLTEVEKNAAREDAEKMSLDILSLSIKDWEHSRRTYIKIVNEQHDVPDSKELKIFDERIAIETAELRKRTEAQGEKKE